MSTNGSTELTRASDPAAGQIARRGFDGQELESRAETASTALAARAKAEVEARYLMALHRPRDIENFRARLLKECKRPGFAFTAEYERPVGREKNEQTGKWEQKIARGPSIRLLETAIQHYGNVVAESPVIYETEETRIVRAQMTDLETNATWTQDIVIAKRVEKRGFEGKPPKGRQVVGQRLNSDGETTYLVLATDDEINVRQLALVSKAQRKNGERLLPSDIIGEAVQVCRETLKVADAADPDAAKRKVIDAFSSMNVNPADLAEFLGKQLDRLQPADLAELRGIYSSISNGELTWEAALAHKQEEKLDGGSKEAQAEVLKNKLSNLGKKPEAETSTKGEAGTGSGESASKSPEASAPTGAGKAPEAPQHVRDFMAYREKIGAEKAWQVLGNHGCSRPEELTQEVFQKMLPDLEAALVDRRAAENPNQEPASGGLKRPLQFGKKPDGGAK